MGDDRASCYWENDKLVIRGSAFGGCIGALVRSGLGVTPEAPPAKLLKAFAEGNTAEPLIVEELVHRDWDMDWTGDAQAELELVVGPVVIRCHPDGVVRGWEGETQDRVLEIKALKPTFPRDFRPYRWQMSVEMAATDLPGLWVYGPKDKDGVVDLDNLDIVPVDVPYFSPVDIKRRALAIYRAVTGEVIPECDFRQFPCGYWTDPDAACGQGKTADEVEEVFLGDGLERAYLAAKRVKDAADRDFKAVSEHIKKSLEDRPGTKYKAGKLRLSKVVGTRRFSSSAAKDAGVDLDPYMVAGKDFWRIDVES